MIKCGIQIASGPVKDSFTDYGLIFVSSDKVFAPPAKGMLEESFQEEAGAHTDGKTVDEKFEYKVKFIIECPNTDTKNANVKIAHINSLMYDRETDEDGNDTDVKVFKEWTIHNYKDRVKITGIPAPISSVDADDYFRDANGNVHDAVRIELKLNVVNPNKCDFSTSNM